MDNYVFISYSSRDRQIAEELCTALESRKVKCWIAPRDILPGSEWVESTVDALDSSSVVVLVLSASSNGSSQVRREVERAASRDIQIIPFRIDDTPLSRSMEFFISAHHWFNAQEPPLERHFQKLADTAKQLLAQATTTRTKREEEQIADKQSEKEAREAQEKAKQEAEEARRAEEAAIRTKKEAEEAAKEQAEKETREAREKARQEAEESLKAEKEAREARERARQEADEARKAEKAAKEQAEKEARAALKREKQEAKKSADTAVTRTDKSIWLWLGIVLTFAGLAVTWFFTLAWRGAFGFPIENEPWYLLFGLVLLFGLIGVIPGVFFMRRGITGYLISKPAEGKVSKWWWLLPVLLGFIGGLVSWGKYKNTNWRKAMNMLSVGIFFTFIFTIPILAA